MSLFSKSMLAQENDTIYKRITPTTYEVPIEDIRKANLIFAEHKNYVEIFAEMNAQAKNMQTQIDLLSKNNKDLEKSNDDYKSSLELKNAQIIEKDTYYTSKIKKTNRQRNTAYAITGVTILLSILVITN